MAKITGKVTITSYEFGQLQEKIINVDKFKKEIELNLVENISEVLKIILGGSICLDASDIHIEPDETDVKIRARIDGVLQDILEFDIKLYKSILSRVKLLSGAKLNISKKPQDGRFSITINDYENDEKNDEFETPVPAQIKKEELIEIRTSVLPTQYGESIVLRILNPKSLIKVEGLGLRKDLFELFKKQIEKPNGMIIVTGPTGSGKTTTLYALLKSILNPEIKIITIEDPVEYRLKGISQTQTDAKKGYDFASGLKSLMRQDPDVILVGEIRDLETANTALQAALTGHLVLTTLHTNDAAGTIARLLSLGAQASNIGPAVNMAVGQRLIRKVCKKCSTLESPSEIELEKIKKAFVKSPDNIECLEILKTEDKIKIPKIKGCKDCNLTGYKGRVGIFETFLIDQEMERFIIKNPSIADLKDLAIKKGMLTMYQDGIIKILQGTTTIEEVERAAGKAE